MLLKCRICYRKKRAGDMSILRTRFARLNDHIRRQHPGVNVTSMTSCERNRRCRSKGQRLVFRCSCRQVVVKKMQHLKSVKFHPELVGVPITASAFQMKLKGFSRLSKVIIHQAEEHKDTDKEGEVEEVVDDMEVSSDDEGETSNDDTREHTLTKQQVLNLKKHDRVMRGRRDFNEVKEWAVWRQRRIGGGKDEEQVEKGKLMINRFLALTEFMEGGSFSSSFKDDQLDVYDTYMVGTFEAGTVRSSYCTINSFMDYLLYAKRIDEETHKVAKMTISNLSCASKKQAARRRKQLQREEAETLPSDSPDQILKRFDGSKFVKEVRGRWSDGEKEVWREMRGILLVEMATKNGTRCGEFRNLKYKHLKNPQPFESNNTLLSLVLDDHKTATIYQAAIHLKRWLYKDLVTLALITKRMLWGNDASDEMFVFHKEGKKEGNKPVPHSLINKWIQQAWIRAEMNGHYPGYQPSLTRNRKVMTTDNRKNKPTKADALSHMMCHRRTTADSHYDMLDQLKRSQETYESLYEEPTPDTVYHARSMEDGVQLAKVMQRRCFVLLERLPDNMIGQTRTREVEEEEEEEKEEGEERLREMVEESEGAIHDYEFICRSVLDEDDTTENNNNFNKYRKEKMSWTKDETEEVKLTFAEAISESLKSNSTIPMRLVTERRQRKWTRFSDQQVREKVRNIVKSRKKYFWR